MLAQKRAEGPVLVLEGGQSLSPLGRAAGSPQETEQRRIKAELLAAGWTAGGLDAMALGPTDWTLGVDFVRGLVEAHHLPVFAANLTCGGEKPYPSGKVFELAGKKVGVVGVTVGTVEGCEVSDPAAALRSAIAELGPVDVRVGLLPVDTDRELVKLEGELPLDVVLDARGKYPQAGPEHRGEAWFIGAGSRGKSVGVATLEFVPGATGWSGAGEKERLEKQLAQAKSRVDGLDKRIPNAKDDAERARFEAQRVAYEKQRDEAEKKLASLVVPGGTNRLSIAGVDLGADIADEPATAALVAAAKAKITTTSGGDPGKFVTRIVTDEGSPYAGGQACVPCHAAEHAQWSTTAHAHAWQSLVTADRAMDDSCWGCHVTGKGAEGGPPTAAESGPWRDVQCEACHGPGKAHLRAPAEVEMVTTPTTETCTACHDGVQDQGRFDAASYLPQVSHAKATP